MNSARDILFEDEVAKERMVGVLPFVLIGLILLRISAWHIMNLPSQTEIGTGVAVNYQMLQLEEGKAVYLTVQQKNEERAIKVRLPEHTAIKIREGVEFNSFYNKHSDKQEHVFVRYIPRNQI